MNYDLFVNHIYETFKITKQYKFKKFLKNDTFVINK